MLQVGDRMPEFTLRNVDREEVTDDDLRGEIVVMAFYVMAFTGG